MLLQYGKMLGKGNHKPDFGKLRRLERGAAGQLDPSPGVYARASRRGNAENQGIDDQKGTERGRQIPVVGNLAVIQPGQKHRRDIAENHRDELRLEVVCGQSAVYARDQKQPVNGNRYHNQPKRLVRAPEIGLERLKNSGHKFTSCPYYRIKSNKVQANTFFPRPVVV